MKNEEQVQVDQLKSGSERAFKQLVHSYQDSVLNTCLGFVPNIQDAEDLVQEVFLEVFRSIGKFREEARISTWIYRICVNKSLEFLRHQKRKKRNTWLKAITGDHELADLSFDHPGIALENRERARILFQKIQQLPESQRIAFVLHKIEGLSHQEISNVMGISISAVESLIHRARKSLQEKLSDYYYHSQL